MLLTVAAMAPAKYTDRKALLITNLQWCKRYYNKCPELFTEQPSTLLFIYKTSEHLWHL